MTGKRPPRRALRTAALALAHATLALALTAVAASNGRAHVGPAAVKSVVAMEAGELTILLLNEGLAVRRGDTWHYVCPALWGSAMMGDADSVQGGPILIGSDTGVWLFHADGSVVAHPDPVAAGGVPLTLRAGRDHIMQLRLEGDVTRLLRLTPDKAEVVWSDLMPPWDSVAVGDDEVAVLRMLTGQLEMLRLATDGSELAREVVMGPESGNGARGRVVGSSLYVTVDRLLPDTSWGVEAAVIESGTWRSLHTGVSFFGPTLGPKGEVIAALDGQLSVLDNGTARALPLDTLVNCVDEFQGFIYACDSIGLRQITAEGPGPALFELQKLQPPEEALVPMDKREMCAAQWDLYQLDLAWVGSLAGVTDAGVPDGSVADGGAPDAMLPAPDGGPGATAGGAAAPLPAVPMAPGASDSNADGGCHIGTPAGSESDRLGVPALLLLAALLRIAPRRSQSRARSAPTP